MQTIDTAETVTIAGRTLTVERTTITYTVDGVERTKAQIWLHGTRGAVYFLREFTGEDTGRRAVVSWKSGAELRDRCSRPVRVVVLGGIIEDVTTGPSPVR